MSRRRSHSLRARVAAATALGAAIIAALLGIFISVAISRNNVSQLDRRLDTASSVLIANVASATSFLPTFGDGGAFAVTIRSGGSVVVSTPTQLPSLEPGATTVRVDGVDYRVVTNPIPKSSLLLSLAVPASEARDVTTDQRQWVIIAGLLAVAAATGLGWIFGGRAVRPIVSLTHQIGSDTPQAAQVSGVREAEELADAIELMLGRIADAQSQTTAALDTARDFAAVSAHELRTPLTAMRTDIEVLSTLELDDAQRAEILADLARTQGRVEATLSALERLASGELSSERDHVPTDLVELCDAASNDAERQNPNLTVRVESDPVLVIRGLPAGMRLAVDNAVANAVRHGGATEVALAVQRLDDGTVRLTVDDNGRGIPEPEREVVFERFRRGSAASTGGSGLGLALVAQQAQLHGGRAWFEDSTLGGARLVFDIPPRP
ncbi:HAMP domain-containing histidine kinase [Rhodococcus spelaei]|uniref:histidine kinase n=1 Tax=Rhodococcus spelaei TaxID=2546320 RepID=A0A541BPC2_9NOCA|nr:HAMP domain-containing sensor histidine kinase [Rhodococcus spelaei]TQF74162.1 HAMP domain-containing histidine kinase [Rhodococcus spelaei]